MIFFNGKYYDDNKLSLISALLYNLKWFGAFIIIFNIGYIVESALAHGLDDEVVVWGILIGVGTVCLFIFKKKWESFSDVMTDKLTKMRKIGIPTRKAEQPK